MNASWLKGSADGRDIAGNLMANGTISFKVLLNLALVRTVCPNAIIGLAIQGFPVLDFIVTALADYSVPIVAIKGVKSMANSTTFLAMDDVAEKSPISLN